MSDLAAVGGSGREHSTAEHLLWGREGELRQFSLQSYNSYRDPWTSDAGLVRSMVSDVPIDKVAVTDPTWESQVVDILAKKGIVALTSNQEMRDLTKAALGILSNPVMVGYHNFYPTIDAYRESDAGAAEIVLALKEKV